jgi:hypothetical protein
VTWTSATVVRGEDFIMHLHASRMIRSDPVDLCAGLDGDIDVVPGIEAAIVSAPFRQGRWCSLFCLPGGRSDHLLLPCLIG